MPRPDVCLEAVFDKEPSLVERTKKVQDAGFDAVEFWFYDLDCVSGNTTRDIDAFGKYCAENGILINNAVVNAPDASIGGSLVDPADRLKYLERLKETINVCKGINVSKAITCTGNAIAGRSLDEQKQSVIDTLKAASEICEKEGFTLFLEPLNTTVDHEGYFCDSAELGAEIVRSVNHPNIKLLFDVYHMQIMGGNVISRIESMIDVIGHFHSAGVPGRQDLDIGELNYPNILKAIDKSGYKGLFGLEYWPAGDEFESLKRMRKIFG
ncbi:MAG: TIM barrel protein [Armatimonadota bacterium]